MQQMKEELTGCAISISNCIYNITNNSISNSWCPTRHNFHILLNKGERSNTQSGYQSNS